MKIIAITVINIFFVLNWVLKVFKYLVIHILTKYNFVYLKKINVLNFSKYITKIFIRVMYECENMRILMIGYIYLTNIVSTF